MGLTRTVNDGRGGVTSTGYDGAGQILTDTQTSSNATTQTSRYSYNNDDMAVSETSDAVGASMSTPWTWTYDAAGNTTGATTPEGQNTTSVYNPDDSLASQTAMNGTTLVSQWIYAYDNLGRETTTNSRQMMPNGITMPLSQTFGYDSAGHLTSNYDSQGQHYSTYDQDGNRLSYSTPGQMTTTPVVNSTAYNADDTVNSTGVTGSKHGQGLLRALRGPALGLLHHLRFRRFRPDDL